MIAAAAGFSGAGRTPFGMRGLKYPDRDKDKDSNASHPVRDARIEMTLRIATCSR